MASAVAQSIWLDSIALSLAATCVLESLSWIWKSFGVSTLAFPISISLSLEIPVYPKSLPKWERTNSDHLWVIDLEPR